jgi:hypothetical protein
MNYSRCALNSKVLITNAAILNRCFDEALFNGTGTGQGCASGSLQIRIYLTGSIRIMIRNMDLLPVNSLKQSKTQKYIKMRHSGPTRNQDLKMFENA